MNPRPQRWRHRRIAYAAAFGALASLAGPLHPALAKGSNSTSDGVVVAVSVPRWEGVLTMTVSDSPIELDYVLFGGDGRTVEFTAALPAVTISDSRYVSEPGWSVTGVVTDFTGGGQGFSGSHLGWTPVITTQNAARDVTAGPPVSPGAEPGLAGGSVLVSAGRSKGLGTVVVGAILDLKIPANVSIGSQSATLSLTLWSTDQQH
jgi:hypothetical protein